MTAIEDTMANLNKMWYNAVADGLGVSKDQFQLIQGETSLGNDQQKIWAMFDAIPPASANNYFNPAKHNSLAQAYGAVINNLYPQKDDSLPKMLKIKYPKWIAYKSDQKNLSALTENEKKDYKTTILALFKNWAIMNLDSDEYDAAVTLMGQRDIVTVAIDQWNSSNSSNTGYAYTAGVTELEDAINKGKSKTVELNTKTASNDASHSWAKGNVSGAYRFFSADAKGHWDKFTQDIEKNGINMKVTFKKVGKLEAGPYGSSSISTDLVDYKPWWNSEALKVAKDNNNNKVWKYTAPTWENTFGPEGNIRWLTTALIVVDGVEITMTSAALITKDERQEVDASMDAGYWPFFQAKAEGGWSHNTEFNDDGTFTVTSSSKEGNPTVIGVLVSPIEKVLGGKSS